MTLTLPTAHFPRLDSLGQLTPAETVTRSNCYTASSSSHSTLPNLIRIKKSDRVAHGPIFQTYTTSPTMLLEMYGLAAGRMQRSLICLKIYQY